MSKPHTPDEFNVRMAWIDAPNPYRQGVKR